MTVTTKRSLIALLLSLVLVVSLFTVGFSATEATTAGETVSVEETTAAASESSSASETEKESATETETEDTAAAEAKAHTTKVLIINSAIIGAIVLIAVILVIKFRTKLGGFLRSVKSENKKIVWSSKEQTKKSFLVVMVVAIIFAVGLYLIDIAFNTGVQGLANIFRG